MSKANKYPSLNFTSENGTPFKQSEKKIIVIEDFPNVGHKESQIQFNDCITNYLHGKSSIVPIVFIVSDGLEFFFFFSILSF